MTRNTKIALLVVAGLLAYHYRFHLLLIAAGLKDRLLGPSGNATAIVVPPMPPALPGSTPALADVVNAPSATTTPATLTAPMIQRRPAYLL